MKSYRWLETPHSINCILLMLLTTIIFVVCLQISLSHRNSILEKVPNEATIVKSVSTPLSTTSSESESFLQPLTTPRP